jgi:hypothetical protein
MRLRLNGQGFVKGLELHSHLLQLQRFGVVWNWQQASFMKE